MPAHARFLELLEWRVLRRLDGLLQGDYRTLLRGDGSDLCDAREYQSDDDVRRIDWNLTARLQTPYERQYREERCLTAWFLIDCSASMDFGAEGANKRAKALEFALAIGQLLSRHNNRVGAMLFCDGVPRILPPASGRTQIRRLLDALARPARAGGSRLTDLREPLAYAACLRPRRSLVFLLSDFWSRPGWEAPLARLGNAHEVVAVHLSHPWERELPRVGALPLQDPETGRQFLVDTRDPTIRGRFAHTARSRAAAVAAAARQAGVDVLPLSSEEDLVAAVARFVAQRRARSASGQAPSSPGRMPEHATAGA
jgi:prepilin-type processing-associated H-X9-DG protein